MTRTPIYFLASALALCHVHVSRAQVTGQGRPDAVPKWTSPSTLGNSALFSAGNRIGIGTATPTARLDVIAASHELAIRARGANGAPGSDRSGTTGLDARGGDADVDSGIAAGGVGVIGIGGAQSQLGQGAGTGGYFAAGRGTYGSAVVGDCGNERHCVAGYFLGDVTVTGTLNAATKNFRIDHPLDPGRKFLQHASVESSEMKNIYDGTIVLDAHGRATVQLPSWFQAENGDFRYQLTSIGAPSPGLYIAHKVEANRFAIAGGAPGVEVSWMVTGIRHDAFALAHPLVVEQDKSAVAGAALSAVPAAFRR